MEDRSWKMGMVPNIDPPPLRSYGAARRRGKTPKGEDCESVRA